MRRTARLAGRFTLTGKSLFSLLMRLCQVSSNQTEGKHMFRKTLLTATLAATALTATSAFADPPPWAPAHGYRAKNDRIAYRETDNGIRYWRGHDGQYYCKRGNGTTGLLVGAALGALLGRAVDTRGDRATGTILGAAGGALIGREIERGQTRCR